MKFNRKMLATRAINSSKIKISNQKLKLSSKDLKKLLANRGSVVMTPDLPMTKETNRYFNVRIPLKRFLNRILKF